MCCGHVRPQIVETFKNNQMNFDWNQQKWAFSCTKWSKLMTFWGSCPPPSWKMSCLLLMQAPPLPFIPRFVLRKRCCTKGSVTLPPATSIKSGNKLTDLSSSRLSVLVRDNDHTLRLFRNSKIDGKLRLGKVSKFGGQGYACNTDPRDLVCAQDFREKNKSRDRTNRIGIISNNCRT